MSRRLLVLAALALGVLALAGSAQAVTFKPFLSGFDQPVYVTAPSSEPGTLYVVEQPGRIQVVDGGKRAGTFLDLSGQVACCGERGLLSLAFHPEYAQNHRFYVDYTDRSGDTRVVEYRSANGVGVPGSARQLLFVDQPYANHNGGQLQFAPDGTLWVGMGDGGAGGDPQNRAQNLGSRLGKLLRIRVDAPGAPVSLAAYGLRNPWRFSFDRANGDLYIGDVGQGAWEEIDYRARGAEGLPNFGWRVYEGRARYTDGQTPNGRGPLVMPVAQYSHSDGCSVTGGYVYRGSAYPALRGRYLYGDFCSGKVWSLVIRNGRATVRRERAVLTNLSSFGEDAKGELYAVSLSGSLYRVTP